RGVELVDPLSEFSLPSDQSIALVKKIRMHLTRDGINVLSFRWSDNRFFHPARFICLGLGVRCSHFRTIVGRVRNAWTENTAVRSSDEGRQWSFCFLSFCGGARGWRVWCRAHYPIGELSRLVEDKSERCRKTDLLPVHRLSAG